MKAVLCGFLLALPALTRANDPPLEMMLFVAIIVAIVLIAAEAAIILIEAAVYAVRLKQRFKSALGMSAVANMASVLAGLITLAAGMRYAFAWIDETIARNLVEATLSIAITLAVEVPIVLLWVRRIRLRSPEVGAFGDSRILWTAIVTNVITNGTMQALFLHW